MHKLRDLHTSEDLANAIGLSRKQLTYWAFVASADRLYTQFEIPKRSGGVRTIKAPRPPLKEIQRRLARLLTAAHFPRRATHGFVRGRNVLTNATPHAARRFILNVDLANFFPSINFGRVRGALLGKPFGLTSEIATAIARLSCHDNELPQGAPTSPVLANIVCGRLDGELSRLAKSYGVRYTRYADDLTFSTGKRSFPPQLASAVNPPYGTEAKVGPVLLKLIESNGFTVNEKKVRLLTRQHAQRVTGLVVNSFPNVDREFVRRIRAMIHAWRKYGMDRAEQEFRQRYATRYRAPFREKPSFQRRLKGMLAYLSMVRGQADPLFIRLAKQCRQLDKKMFPDVLDKQDLLERAVWIVESDVGQGTGFFLAGIGFVTCAHVIGVGHGTHVFHKDDTHVQYPAKVVRIDEHLDLAILDVSVPSPKSLALGNPEKLGTYDKILVAGYPNFGFGDGLYTSWGTVTMRKVRHGVKYLVPSVAIAMGNSGGPVLDEQYRVVGVASKGAKSLALAAEQDPDSYGAIFISHVSALSA
jgi:RNA-directed DNA polymerase